VFLVACDALVVEVTALQSVGFDPQVGQVPANWMGVATQRQGRLKAEPLEGQQVSVEAVLQPAVRVVALRLVGLVVEKHQLLAVVELRLVGLVVEKHQLLAVVELRLVGLVVEKQQLLAVAAL
jgi:hypothetical protein